MGWLFGTFKVIVALFQLWSYLFAVVGKGLLFSWPISVALLAILISEFPHAPRKWECRFSYALAPFGIQLVLLAWAAGSVFFPPLKMLTFGLSLAMPALFLQIISAAYAWKKVEGYNCFFLALMLLEIWIGFWVSIIAGAILSRPF